jgi:hypothetical protein
VTGTYVEIDGQVVPEPDPVKFNTFMKDFDRNRRVALDQVGEMSVSTVFLGLDHGYREKDPVLYETLVRGPLPDQMDRYHTRAEALAGHERWVEWARQKWQEWEAGEDRRIACPHCSREFIPDGQG